VSRRAGSSHSSTVTVSLFCRNYRRCSCSRIQHPGVSLTYGDAFQRCSQQPLTFSKSYGECLDHFLTSSEMIECGSGTYDFCVPHRVPAEDLCDLLLESSPVAIHLAFVGLSIDLLRLISGFLAINHGKPKARSYTFIGTTKTSDSSTGLRYSKNWTKRLAFRLSFADIITGPG